MKQTPEVHSITRRINGREDAIQGLRKATIEKANQTIAEVLLQGQDLISLRFKLAGTGDFFKYLAAECPAVEIAHAQGYMRAAKNPERFSDVRQLMLMWPEQEQERPKKEAWDGWYGAIHGFAKWTRTIAKTPIESWPDPGKERLRAQLLPIASQLWPERFA